MNDVAILILAGGTGTRLGGVCKALVRLNGRPLLQHTMDLLGETLAPCAIAIGNQAPTRFHRWIQHAHLLPDKTNISLGPVAALIAGVEWAESLDPQPRYMLTLPCDTPAMPRDVVEALRAPLPNDKNVRFICANGQLHPTHALWRLNKLTKALSEFADCQTPLPGPRHILPSAQTQILICNGRPEQFQSANTVLELLKLSKLLG